MNRYLLFSLLVTLFGCNAIDRFALVNRHHVVITDIDPLNSLTVGNGEFAYTADITGMQTFPSDYEKGISPGTFSQWGWHSFPNPQGYSSADVVKNYKVGNDSVPYLFQFSMTDGERRFNASEWLRENPHRLHLGLVGLLLMNTDSSEISITDIVNPSQELNLWTGELSSCFQIGGITVRVITCCHQQQDLVAFRIHSGLIKQGRLKVKISFPYASHDKNGAGYDFAAPEKHHTIIQKQTSSGVTFRRQMDSTVYYVDCSWKGSARVVETNPHVFEIIPSPGADSFELVCSFSNKPVENQLPSFTESSTNSRQGWKYFWESGAVVDFSNCTDPRAFELERRVVLSQYLTKIQCAGSLPPQETGLTMNSWYGKFHLEMLWWHTAHFIQWGRPDLMEKQLQFYFNAYAKAKATAIDQGYDGVRWQKMTDPSGKESPSTIGPFLVWQQPHIIYLSELLYRFHGNDSSILRKYHGLVESTADFMASYARWDSISNRYVLGPALIPAQECFAPETTMNPAFELAYWHWALSAAQHQRILLGLGINRKWQQVIDHLSLLSIKDSLYLFTENTLDSYTNPRFLTDHPIILGIEGFLPFTGWVDQKVMENTFNAVLENWNWNSCWGWDFPLSAMCATMFNHPGQAIDLLLMDTPKNSYLLNGHNYQRESLPIYLPGNSSLLSAVAFMCSYRNKNGEDGFPLNGKWNVKYENFFPLHPTNR